jgi:hypothetical protein
LAYGFIGKPKGVTGAAGEVYAQNRAFAFPAPVCVLGCQEEAVEELFAGGKGAVEGVYQEAFAESPGAREKVVFASLDELGDVGGLVDVSVPVFPHFREALNADGELLRELLWLRVHFFLEFLVFQEFQVFQEF